MVRPATDSKLTNMPLVSKARAKVSSKKSALGVDLGGVTLDNTTSGDPMQRLLIGYKSNNMRPLAQLLDLLANKIEHNGFRFLSYLDAVRFHSKYNLLESSF